MKLASTLVAMLFVAAAAAVATEMLKREPSSPLASGIVHCNAKCVPVDCPRKKEQGRSEYAAVIGTLQDLDSLGFLEPKSVNMMSLCRMNEAEVGIASTAVKGTPPQSFNWSLNLTGEWSGPSTNHIRKSAILSPRGSRWRIRGSLRNMDAMLSAYMARHEDHYEEIFSRAAAYTKDGRRWSKMETQHPDEEYRRKRRGAENSGEAGPALDNPVNRLSVSRMRTHDILDASKTNERHCRRRPRLRHRRSCGVAYNHRRQLKSPCSSLKGRALRRPWWREARQKRRADIRRVNAFAKHDHAASLRRCTTTSKTNDELES
ncbi:hypothetical protein C8R45DRAFT_1073593 [Mycena sanguinolenta]|nr:hypothetical protein C8R45DRAFT_1073593 [Mycena sanguinolenta]